MRLNDYRDDEDRRKREPNMPQNAFGLAVVAAVFPELIKLYKNDYKVLLVVIALIGFIAGSILHILFIDKPIRKREHNDAAADFKSTAIGIAIFLLSFVFLYFRYKFHLY